MAYEVLARKWRPKQFDAVIGQEHVTRTLKNAIRNQRVAHAFLFVGPRGIGKTSLARILAKALNCSTGPTEMPCDKCAACQEIAGGFNIDVLEIDGASNNGVDQVRDLRDSVRLMPARGPYRIYIIDEVHMLTTAAFNALLKTLEEPPPHVKFIFATTEPQKVPATILSRCQRFDLRPIAQRKIKEHLASIAAAEKIQIDEEALWAIARVADGGLRDAESALEQLRSFTDGLIKEADVVSVFGLLEHRLLEALASAILTADIPTVLAHVDELDSGGKDLQRVLWELIAYLRDVLIMIYTPGQAEKLEIASTKIAALRQQVTLVKPEQVLRMVDILVDADQKIRFALSARTVFEVAVIRAARTSQALAIEDALEELRHWRKAFASDQQTGVIPQPAAAPVQQVVVSKATPKKNVSETVVDKAAAVEPARGKEDPADTVALLQQWPEIVREIGKLAPLARAAFSAASPVAVAGTIVTIGFDPDSGNVKSGFDCERNVKSAQRVLSNILHREVTVNFVRQKAEPPAATFSINQTLSAQQEEATPSSPDETPKMAGKSKQQWAKMPAVRKVLESFDGDIVEVT